MLKVLKGFPPYFERIDSSKPTFLGIHLKPICNFRCRKCFIGDQKKLLGLEEILSPNEIFKIMESAKRAGIKVFGITGAGEPLLDSRIYRIVKKANESGFITHIPTNISTLNKDLVRFLKENNVTLVLSFDTVDKNKFLYLTNVTNEKVYNQILENVKMAQEIYAGTKEIMIRGEGNIEVYRIAIHMTIHEKNIDEIDEVKKLVIPDTLFSISPLAYEGFASRGFEFNEIDGARDKTEDHIVICRDKEMQQNICGFFRFGLDINFDGQLLLDAHAIETRKVLKNIRDFNYNVRVAYNYLQLIKIDFIKNGYLQGFCPVRSPRLKKWIKEREKILEIENQFKDQILNDIKVKKPLLKYSYVGEGAKGFLDVLQSPEYHTHENEMAIINKHIEGIKKSLTENIVVLGTGDGTKLKNLLSHYKKENVVLVDISEILLDICKKSLGRDFRSITVPFEELNFRDFPKSTTFIILGGTIGNLDSWKEFLKEIKVSVPKGKVIVGLELLDMHNPEIIEKIIREYDNESGFKFVFHPLSILGFTRNDGYTRVSFNYNKSRIEEYFIPNILAEKKMKDFGLKGNRKILLSISTKTNKNEFVKEVKRMGIKIGFFYKRKQNYIIELNF